MEDQVKKTATRLALKHYLEQIWGIKHYSIPALLFVGVGATFTQYAPALVVAAVIQRFGTSLPDLRELMPYVLLFAGLWFTGEMLWRASFHFTQVFEVRAMENLYINALRELAKRHQLLPRQLRRLAHQTDAQLRTQPRKLLRHHSV
jgi:hypothetical protein